MHNVKLSTDKSLDKGQEIDIDFDIINHENAIMYNHFNKKYDELDAYGDKIHSGITKDKGKLEGDTLTIPYGTSPGNLSISGAKTIGEFLKWHDLNYKPYNDLILNKEVVRENLLESILSSDF